MSKQVYRLTRERLRELLEYIPETGVFVRRRSASNVPAGHATAGSLAKNGYLRIRVDGVLYYSHRLAWMYMTGEFPEHDVDHADGDKANNALANLRKATRAENLQNLSKESAASSGVRGAYLEKSTGKWVSKIGMNGSSRHLGAFLTSTEAHEAYKNAKREIHTFSPELRK